MTRYFRLSTFDAFAFALFLSLRGVHRRGALAAVEKAKSRSVVPPPSLSRARSSFPLRRARCVRVHSASEGLPLRGTSSRAKEEREREKKKARESRHVQPPANVRRVAKRERFERRVQELSRDAIRNVFESGRKESKEEGQKGEEKGEEKSKKEGEEEEEEEEEFVIVVVVVLGK